MYDAKTTHSTTIHSFPGINDTQKKMQLIFQCFFFLTKMRQLPWCHFICRHYCPTSFVSLFAPSKPMLPIVLSSSKLWIICVIHGKVSNQSSWYGRLIQYTKCYRLSFSLSLYIYITIHICEYFIHCCLQ